MDKILYKFPIVDLSTHFAIALITKFLSFRANFLQGVFITFLIRLWRIYWLLLLDLPGVVLNLDLPLLQSFKVDKSEKKRFVVIFVVNYSKLLI